MFAHFEGKVAEKNADSIVIDCGGVGYQLSVSAATLSQAPAVGEKMKLFSVLNVREDAMELYGFYSREEKRMYERLRSVSGVGPKMALAILSSMSVRDISLALVTGDATALTHVPGIGKKTAQRLVLELKDKVEESQLVGEGAKVAPVRKGNPAVDEAVAALVALGYSSAEAAQAVAKVSDKADNANDLIFLALKG